MKTPEHHEHIVDKCAFCSILQGKDNQQERIFYQDESYVAMLVNLPRSPGHFIVFPREHRSELSEMSNELGNFFEKTYELAEAAISKLSAPAYELKLNNNIYQLDPDPNHVGHIHMHVVPRYSAELLQVEVTPEYFISLVLRLT